MHIIDSYLQRIIAANTSCSLAFAQYLNANSQFVVALRSECDGAAQLLTRAGIEQQKAFNYVADIVAGGAYVKFVQSNQYLQASITAPENNFLQQAVAKLNTLKQELATVNQRFANQGQQQNNSFDWTTAAAGGGSSATRPNVSGGGLLDIGSVPEPTTTIFGINAANPVGSIFDTAAEPVIKPVVAAVVTPSIIINPTKQPECVNAANLLHVKVVKINPGVDMKLEYVQHEKNLAFYTAFTTYGKLVPEDHTRVVNAFIEGFDNNVNTILTEEPMRLGYVEHNVDITNKTPGFTTTQPKTVADLKSAVFALENHVAIHFGPDFTDVTKLPIKGPVMLSNQWFVDSDVAQQVMTLGDCTNLLALGEAMKAMKEVLPTRIWFEIEHELTRYVNNYLCSTLPALIRIGSFTEDVNDLQNLLISDVSFTTPEEEYDTFYRFSTDILSHIGQFIYMGSDELQSQMFEEGATPTEGTLLPAGKSGLLFSEALRYIALTRFTAAELQIACPKLIDAKIQPTGGYVDPTSLPELHNMLSLILSEATTFQLNEAYLLTEDGFYLRASRALMMDGFILDAPVAL